MTTAPAVQSLVAPSYDSSASVYQLVGWLVSTGVAHICEWWLVRLQAYEAHYKEFNYASIQDFLKSIREL